SRRPRASERTLTRAAGPEGHAEPSRETPDGQWLVLLVPDLQTVKGCASGGCMEARSEYGCLASRGPLPSRFRYASWLSPLIAFIAFGGWRLGMGALPRAHIWGEHERTACFENQRNRTTERIGCARNVTDHADTGSTTGTRSGFSAEGIFARISLRYLCKGQ